MADEVKKPEPWKFNSQAALAKLDAVEKAHEDVAGKPNYNPFFIIREVGALRAQVKRGIDTKELQAEIDKLPTTPTKVNNNLVEEQLPPTKTMAAAPTSAAGLKLPTKK